MVSVASLHLQRGSGDHCGAMRRQQVRRVVPRMSGSALELAGDFNILLDDELHDVRSVLGMRGAPYSEYSRDLARFKYHAVQDGAVRSMPGVRFDRVLYSGSVAVEVHMVGGGKVFSEGCAFILSDHAGLLAFIDVDDVHRLGLSAARQRRVALCRARDLESASEKSAGRRDAWLMKEKADHRRAVDLVQQARALVRGRAVRLD